MSSIADIRKTTGSRFLSYYELDAVHRDGHISPYYMASRNPNIQSLKAITHANPPDGVVIFSIFQGKLVLIRQFRYPVNDYVYEFPAGLVEPGEDMMHAAVREMQEETGLVFSPIDAGSYSRPFFTTVGMTDESCGTVFGFCSGHPTNSFQEQSEDIQVVLADPDECRRILKEENVALMCAYMMMQYIAHPDAPFSFLPKSDT